MEAFAVQGLSMIAEDFGDRIEEVEEQRSFVGKSLYDGRSNAKPLVKRARWLLYRRLKVEVVDGRVFVGKFHCLDKQGSVILCDAVEFRNVSGLGGVGVAPVEQRSLGMVLIPARWRTSCYVECWLDEKMDLLSIGS